MKKIMKNLGPGFIAVLSGIELTNVFMYMLFGRLYGLIGVLLVTISIIPMIFVQEAITVPKILYGTTPSSYLLRHRRKTGVFYLVTIYFGSILVLLVNAIIISVLLSNLFGGSWLPYLLLVVLVASLIPGNSRIGRSIEKILAGLSLFLLIYFVAFIISLIHGSVDRMLSYSTPSLLMIIALWGAASSPYSMLVQEDDDDLGDLSLSLLVSIIISFSISGIASITNIRTSIIGALALTSQDYYYSYLVIIGLISTTILAMSTIFVTVGRIISGSIKVLKTRVSEISQVFYSVVAFMFILSCIIAYVGHSALEELVIFGSAFIGIISTLAMYPLLIYYFDIYTASKNRIIGINLVGLLVTVVVLTLIILLSFLF